MGSHAATQQATTVSPLPMAASYAELLEPVSNAAERLAVDDAVRLQHPDHVRLAQNDEHHHHHAKVIIKKSHHHHHHHHRKTIIIKKKSHHHHHSMYMPVPAGKKRILEPSSLTKSRAACAALFLNAGAKHEALRVLLPRSLRSVAAIVFAHYQS
jgi:hypothetical protein